MSQKPNTPVATTKTAFQRMVERLVKRLEAENEPQCPGIVMNYDARTYDEGGYGDPMIDDRPDFIKEDERGWTKLK